MKHRGERYKQKDWWSSEKMELYETKGTMSLKKDSDHLKNMEIYETQRRKLEKRR